MTVTHTTRVEIPSRASMNTKDIGETSEAKALAALKSRNYSVLRPFGDNQKYDLVYESQEGFQRVQVRTGRYKKGCIIFKSEREYFENGNRKHSTFTNKDIDEFIVVCGEIDGVYKISVEDASDTQTRLRVDEPKAPGNMNKVKWAEDYKL